LIAKDYPALRNHSDYEAFKRKWQYLFAYAGAGFSKGYITCHMLTFIRPVSVLLLLPLSHFPDEFNQNDTPCLRSD
jgi:cyclopropane-fatty-acyl-phospholipid synthase